MMSQIFDILLQNKNMKILVRRPKILSKIEYKCTHRKDTKALNENPWHQVLQSFGMNTHTKFHPILLRNKGDMLFGDSKMSLLRKWKKFIKRLIFLQLFNTQKLFQVCLMSSIVLAVIAHLFETSDGVFSYLCHFSVKFSSFQFHGSLLLR